mmetsp:Transcript_3169/g.8416  ORF Transcript_3169/g.8416 Transcript_3169/m.8416 type:complete len:235 (+) Transcript_3169:1-705(+)
MVSRQFRDIGKGLGSTDSEARRNRAGGAFTDELDLDVRLAGGREDGRKQRQQQGCDGEGPGAAARAMMPEVRSAAWVEWVFAETVDDDREVREILLYLAIFHGHVSSAAWLWDKVDGALWDRVREGAAEPDFLRYAAAGGHLETVQFCVRWLRREAPVAWERVKDPFCLALAERGRLAILRWVHAEEAAAWRWREELAAAAARHRQVPTLRWLQSQGCPMTPRARSLLEEQSQT